ncbi:MAG: efflux RND transporter periplasmic adaptor subunit, partial [Bacteroidetes bacterium]|nr:efflux RND transporter periplasmic adaptor subunit [Bacteroidota bacterium]
ESSLGFLEENTTLRAPISGIITGKYLNDGEVYTMSPNRETGKPGILTIMQIEKIKVLIGVSEQYFPVLKKGQKTKLKLDIYSDKEFEGVIYKIHPTIDRMTRTFVVEVEVRNNEKLLRPGMFARVEINMGKISTVMIPSVAVMKQTGTNDRYVFLAEKGKAVRKNVKPGKNFGDKIEILSGIKTGEELIITGQTRLLDQSLIKVIE